MLVVNKARGRSMHAQIFGGQYEPRACKTCLLAADLL